MAPIPCSDLSAAAWIASSDLPWQRLVTFGPAGFDGYARLRFIPDPVFEGQSENDATPVAQEHDLLGVLFEVLGAETETPEDCYFCVWDGYGAVSGNPKIVIGRVSGPRTPSSIGSSPIPDSTSCPPIPRGSSRPTADTVVEEPDDVRAVHLRGKVPD